MRAKKRVWKPFGYSFADLLVLTDATRSNLIHWTNTNIIRAEIEDTDGRGYPRRFSPFNVIEVQLASAINKFRVPVETIRGALSIFKVFHTHALAIHEVTVKAPLATEPAHLALFQSDESRRAVARSYLWNTRNSTETLETTVQKARALGEVWASVRSGPFVRGMTDPSWQHFLALFIDPDTSAIVVLDPTPTELHNAVGGSAIVIDLVSVVFQVGQHCKKLGQFELGKW